MKKHLCILLVFLLVGSFLSAQENKAIKAGNFTIASDLTASLAIGSETLYDEDGEEVPGQKNNLFNIVVGLKGGYFVIDGLEIGPAIGIDYENTTNDENEDIYLTVSQIGIGVQGGYYFDLGGMLALYGRVTAYYVIVNTDSSGTESSSSGYKITPEIGAALFLCDNVTIQIGIYLDYQSITQTDPAPEMTQGTMTYGLILGTGIFL